MTEARADFDVIVIGGGINGAGIARDAALRGMSVLLLEANDFGSGTSSWSSRLIHGGLRYLEHGEIPLVYESLHERRRLRKTAGHLVRPLRLLIPLYRGGQRAPWLVRLGMVAYDLLSIGKALPGHKMLRLADVIKIAPGIRTDGLLGAAAYFDAQVTFAERLVIENIVAAAEAGATLRNYTRVSEILPAADGTQTVKFDVPDGSDTATAQCVVNAAGPWVDRVLANAPQPQSRLMGGTKGSHIVVAPFKGAPSDACYVEAASDGRPLFIIPWNRQYLIGTTDIRFDGDPADARPSSAEVDYLLETVNQLFPKARLSRADIAYAYAGVRPLPFNPEGPESAITRRHIIHRHAGAEGRLLSIIGGKLTTYRNLAEQVVDKISAFATGELTECVTDEQPLPGGGAVDASVLEAFSGLESNGRERLLSLYGSRCSRLAELARSEPDCAALLDAESGIVAAEVALAVRDEFARNLIDIVHRRMMTGLSASQGVAANEAIAAAAARELGWSDAQKSAELKALAEYNGRLRRLSG